MFFKKKNHSLTDEGKFNDDLMNFEESLELTDTEEEESGEDVLDIEESIELDEVEDEVVDIGMSIEDETEDIMIEDMSNEDEIEIEIDEIADNIAVEEVPDDIEVEEISDDIAVEEVSETESEDVLELTDTEADDDVLELSEVDYVDGIRISDVDDDVENVELTDDKAGMDSKAIEDSMDSMDDLDSDNTFPKRWALTLSMAAAAVLIGVSSVAVVTIRQGSNVVTVNAGADATTENFLIVPSTYASVEKKSISLEAVPEDTTITLNIMNSELEPCTGVTFKAVAVKGTADDNRDFLVNVVNNESLDDIEDPIEVSYVQSSDEDMDGTITFSDLDEDTYTVALLSADGYNPVEPVEVSTVSYHIIDNISEKVVAESAQTIQEDPENGRNTAAEPTEATAAPTTTAASEAKEVEIDVVKEIDGEIVYDVEYGGTKQITKSELGNYDQKTVLVSSGDGVSSITGYVSGTGRKKVNGETVTYVKQLLVPNSTNVSYIDGNQFSIMSLGEKESTTAESTSATADATTKDTAVPSTTQPTTTLPTTTQPTTTQPATTVAPTTEAVVTYRVINLEPVIEKETVYDGWVTVDGNKCYYEDGKAVTGWHQIDGIQYYFNSKGVLGSKTVIDVSRFNGSINWSAVKASGIDYAIIRVGYRGYESGKLVMDSKFEDNMKGAIAAGIKVGAYVVTQAVNTTEAVEEASFIVEACRKYSISLPLVIDVETAGGGSGRGDKISASTRTAVINAYAQTVRSAGYTPMVYASKSWLEGRIKSASISSYCQVWIARYHDTLGYSSRYNMWQFRSDGSVSGISGSVDISAWLN